MWQFSDGPDGIGQQEGKIADDDFSDRSIEGCKQFILGKRSDLLHRFMMVDLPTLVYPTRATRTICPRFLRWVDFCLFDVLQFLFQQGDPVPEDTPVGFNFLFTGASAARCRRAVSPGGSTCASVAAEGIHIVPVRPAFLR